MLYSRKQIDKAGQILLSSKDRAEFETATKLIDDWRLNHLPVLKMLEERLNELFKEEGVTFLFPSQRLKLMTSIQDKLDKKPDMKLGGLNDIGGQRYVFTDIESVYKAKKLISTRPIEGFELLAKQYDYIDQPAESGYRSIHLVFKCHHEDERYDGLRVELQLRTKLQHIWATAVESGEIITGKALKNSQGPTDWLDFFKLTSALFSLGEQCPILAEYKDYDGQSICASLKRIEEQTKCIDLLRAFKAALRSIENNEYAQEYYILKVDYVKRVVNVSSFAMEDQEKASQYYNELEKKIENHKNAVILVSVDGLKDLRAAYPSYFIDTTEFLEKVESFLSLY
jgi:hypothetical protein